MVLSGAPFLTVSMILFGIGACGVLLRRDAITVLMGIELMLNAANLAFLTFARQWQDGQGQIFVLLVIGVAAAEAAVGLALIIRLKRRLGSIQIEALRQLKG